MDNKIEVVFLVRDGLLPNMIRLVRRMRNMNLPPLRTEKLPQPLPVMSMEMRMMVSMIMCYRASRRLAPKERLRSVRHVAQQSTSQARYGMQLSNKYNRTWESTQNISIYHGPRLTPAPPLSKRGWLTPNQAWREPYWLSAR